MTVERLAAYSFSPLDEPPQSLPDGRPVRRLNLNESPVPPIPAVVKAMAEAASGAHRYPDGECRVLVERLARCYDVPRERIFVGAGSNELLAASADMSLDIGDEMIAPVPAFPTYEKLAKIRGAKFVGVPTTAGGRIDVDRMLAAVTPRTRLVFVSSPHNPTGAVMTEREVRTLVAQLPEHVLLHFDEAYFEFGRVAGAVEALPILETRKGPWISTRTFSKAYGLAGARVGFGIAATSELAVTMRKIRPNYSLNIMALAGALAALENLPASRRLVDNLLIERRRIIEALEPAGFEPLEGSANFVALIPPGPSRNWVSELQAEGIYINGFPLGDRYALRITLGTAEDTDAVVSTLKASAAKK